MDAIVLDDDPAMVSTLVTLLKDEGYRVFAASTVSSARALIETQRCDVALIDLALGEGRGRDLLDELAPLRVAPPMIVVSGIPDAVEVAAEFAIPFVPKPFEIDRLLSAIAVARTFHLRPQHRSGKITARRRIPGTILDDFEAKRAKR